MSILHTSRKSLLLLLALAVLLSLTTAPALLADDDDDDGGGAGSRCVVKFVCGEGIDSDRAADGEYRTAINILNAGTDSVHYSKKLALTTPCEDGDELPGPSLPSTLIPIEGDLGMMLAFDVDCSEIREEFEAGECGDDTLDLVEGFLILESDGPLDVTAVYTTEGGIDVEAVTCTGAAKSSRDDDDDD